MVPAIGFLKVIFHDVKLQPLPVFFLHTHLPIGRLYDSLAKVKTGGQVGLCRVRESKINIAGTKRNHATCPRLRRTRRLVVQAWKIKQDFVMFYKNHFIKNQPRFSHIIKSDQEFFGN
jgi:hypothetical protein